MANTVIALKKSGTPGVVPSSLQFGELGINYADGKLFYKNNNSQIAEISGQQINYFGTVNANNTLVVADAPADVLTFIPGNNISIVGDAVNDTITISANIKSVFDKANAALANSTGTFAGTLSVTEKIIALPIGGDEGGEILLEKPPNGTLDGGVTIDAYQNKLRIFEQGGSARGVYIDLSVASAGVGTDLLASSGTTDTTARTTASAAFDKANAANVLAFNALPNTSGATFAGDLTISGRAAIGTNTHSSYILNMTGTVATRSGGYRVLSDGINLNLWRDLADTETRMQIGYNATAGQGLLSVINTAAPLIINTSNLERIRVTNTGNVGIGITSPTSQLHVNGAVNIMSSLTTTSNVVTFGSAFKIDANGDVFIFGTLNMLY